MKMVKRSLIAIAVVALLATTVQAGYSPNLKYDDHWPYEYVAVDLCTIPVYMDVGLYVQIKDCDKRKIELKQVDCAEIDRESKDFPCYLDCEEFEIRANFEVKLGVKKAKADPTNLKDWDAYYDGEDTVPGDGNYYKRKVCVKAWKTEIWKSSPGDKVKVGEVTITVKPN
jgi:hypothetical protein